MMYFNFRRALVTLALSVTFCVTSSHCFQLNTSLGTRTPYYPQQEQSKYRTPPPGCSAVHINLVARHGARNPTSSWVKKILALTTKVDQYAKNVSKLNFPWMKNWTNPFVETTSGWLVVTGEEEHYNLAKRMQDYYPSVVFNQSWALTRYPIRSTAVSRAGRSANSFAFGMFEGKGTLGPSKFDPFFIVTDNKTVDYELRFFDTCPNYEKEVKHNDTANIESTNYAAKILPTIAANITKKVGIPGLVFTDTDISALWQLCGLQIADRGISNEWCTLLSEQEVLDLNYIDDLSSYWLKGWGHKINYEIACPLLSSFNQAFKGVMSAPSSEYSERANLRFAHSETIFPFATLLGLFKDNFTLRADTPMDQREKRLWRSSVIAPFASNIAMVLYNCSRSYKIKLLVNEKEYTVPGCSDLYCPFDEFQKLFAIPLNKCDFYSMCGFEPCPPNGDGDSSSSDSKDDDEFSLKKPVGLMIAVAGFFVGAILGGVTACLCSAGTHLLTMGAGFLFCKKKDGEYLPLSSRSSKYELVTNQFFGK